MVYRLRGAICAMALVLMAFGCGGDYEKKVGELNDCILSRDSAASGLAKCRQEAGDLAVERDKLQKDQTVLIETNARLSLQLETYKLQSTREEVNYKDRLLECEYKVKEQMDVMKERDESLEAAKGELAAVRVEADKCAQGGGAGALDPDKAEKLFLALNAELKGDLKRGVATVTKHPDRLVVQVLGDILFNTGSSDLSPAGTKVLLRLAKILRAHQAGLRMDIAGHTDDLKLTQKLKKKYPTNWELSALRATSALKLLAGQGGLESRRLSVSAHSEYRPLGPNVSDAARARNRRIEIVITQEPKAAEGAK